MIGPLRRRLRAALRSAARRLGVPPRHYWPFALPGAPGVHELRWRLRLRRAPVVSAFEHARAVGVRDREEPLACTLCGGERVRPLFHARPGKPPEQRYHVVRCVRCGLLYRNPGIRPERLGELYAGAYGRFLEGAYSAQRRRRYALVLDAFGPLFADGRDRRLLDFGCGTGLFLELAAERGFDPAYGVDLSPDAVRRARERPSGRHAYVGDPADVPEIAAGGFDVITLWSVLAHLPRPLDELRRLRGLLGRDGVLLILTVNANSLALKAEGAAWGAFTPNHLVFFAPATLARALGEAGFGAVVMPPMPPDPVAAGTASLGAAGERRLRRAIARGNRGNMLRAAAFADPDGPARWGLPDPIRLR